MATLSPPKQMGGTIYVKDRLAVKVDGDAYRGKTGIIALTLTSLTFASAADVVRSTVDLRVPNFFDDTDNILIDNLLISGTSSAGLGSLGVKYIFAVNNGVPSPSVQVQGDNTWDLMWLTINLVNTLARSSVNFTLTYSVAFTDLTTEATVDVPLGVAYTPVNPTIAGSGEVSVGPLHVHDTITQDGAIIGDVSGASNGKNGYWGVQFDSIIVETYDNPDGLHIDKDSVPNFHIDLATSPGGGGSPASFMSFPLSKTSGTKVFDPTAFFLFAVNNGKIDGNGLSMSGLGVQFFQVILEKLAEWPCDDDVKVTLNYREGFTQIL